MSIFWSDNNGRGKAETPWVSERMRILVRTLFSVVVAVVVVVVVVVLIVGDVISDEGEP